MSWELMLRVFNCAVTHMGQWSAAGLPDFQNLNSGHHHLRKFINFEVSKGALRDYVIAWGWRRAGFILTCSHAQNVQSPIFLCSHQCNCVQLLKLFFILSKLRKLKSYIFCKNLLCLFCLIQHATNRIFGGRKKRRIRQSAELSEAELRDFCYMYIIEKLKTLKNYACQNRCTLRTRVNL